ncbi:MAG: hypothetical protein M1820_003220 [Bogoriella megaspora]|nr:MAG: hypothetical protein M1820_003220 [Bogoriella megaspora]
MTKAYDEKLPMSSVPPFYQGVELNYAENALEGQDLNGLALIGIREGEDLKGENVTWRQLKERVRRLSNALRIVGVRKEEVVAALVSNSVEAVVLFLASASIGAVFTSIAPDLGIEGCVSRLRQVNPRILFVDSHATYKGHRSSMLSKTKSIVSKLDNQPSVYIIPVSSYGEYVPSCFPTFDSLIALASSSPISYTRVPFMSPLIIVYSSGTTGPPKCIVHHHGLILQLKKISILHNSLSPNDIVMQYSSTSWIMFYIMNGHLTTGATVICYDGSPLYPDCRQLLRVLHYHRVTYFGSSPRYLFELEKAGSMPKIEYDLSQLRMVNTTGASLSSDQYRWFYANFPAGTHLVNTAGGTDLATSLCAADPAGPVYLGEMQVFGLGMDVDIADAETGESIKGQVDWENDKMVPKQGELVVRKPFPSMPAFFWGDKDRSVYRSAYFERWGAVDCWAMHDWMSYNPNTKGTMMHGRSDGVLNPSGIRFGSGEIYSICEGPSFNSQIAETLCVGRKRPQDRDETVFLFVKMSSGQAFSNDLVLRLRETIKTGLSARHVPRYILEVDEIPVTINGKKVETAVKQLISGKDIKISSTVANPDVLRGYSKYRSYGDGPIAKL